MARRSRIPDRCPRHPMERTYRKQTREVHNAARYPGAYRLVQHECGEECGTPLGWEFHTPTGESHYGPGECRDERVLRNMEQAQRYRKHDDRMSMIFALTGTASIFSLCLINIIGPWGLAPAAGIITAGAAAMRLVSRAGPGRS